MSDHYRSGFPAVSNGATAFGCTIALDMMGGDLGPEAAVGGAHIIHQQRPQIRFMMYGDERQISPALSRYPDLAAVSRIIHTDKVVLNHEKPSNSLRTSKGTSMRMAIEAVQHKQADAVVSAGNTGALMAMAKLVLRPLPGIHRPAIASVFPSEKDNSIMLDLGANVLVDAENLVQFAVLGAIFAKAHKKIAVPTVGLLNVGSEDTKGPDHVRAAAAVLSKIEFPGRYYGFVEGTDILQGTVDVVVSDGYAGNIALKTAEGFGKFAGQQLKKAIKSDPLAMLGGLFTFFALRRVKRKMDPRLYNGGVFLGLNGLCVKSHGGADALGFSSAIRLAADLAQHGYVQKVADEISHLMAQDSLLAHGTFHG